MKTKHVSVVVLYTADKRILLQDRSSFSKSGKSWGFFGGKIEAGETKEQAAKRELNEELEFKLNSPVYLGQVSGIVKDIKPQPAEKHLIEEVFVSPISPDLSQFTLHEGDGMKLFSILEASTLKMNPVDFKALDLVEKYFESV